MQTLPSNSIDLTITDIPYGEAHLPSNGLRQLDKGTADVVTFDLAEFMAELVRITSGSIYIFCGTGQFSTIDVFFRQNKITRRAIVLEKTNPSPMNGKTVWLSGVELAVFGKKAGATYNEFCRNTVFRYPSQRNKLHPTQKPLGLMKEFIRASSNEGDVVFDPCTGSGTTAIAAIELKRRFVGCEMDEQFHAIALERITSACASLLNRQRS